MKEYNCFSEGLVLGQTIGIVTEGSERTAQNVFMGRSLDLLSH